jgi:eukaryotic-like serine/threonine-protein kinase
VTVTDDDEAPESEYDDLLRAIARAPERAPTPADSVLAPGSVIAGKFRVVRPLGVGGMGKVYEVEHELTRHRRALKVLHAGSGTDVVERFVREASAAARIGNPHVAQTFDAGRLEGGEPYLLMELLDGETLEARLHRAGPIDPGELSALIHQACEGIQAAHEAGIIHRDLKPDNIFVEVREEGPFVKILDFGISKFDPGQTGAPGITRDGSVMGTPYYMAPEQVRGASSIDARTDVYALGVILYECACGKRPFDATSVEHLAVLIHQGRAVPLVERAPSLPRTFCEIVARAMATDPRDRFESARALADALAPLRRHVIRSDAGDRATSTSPSAQPVSGAAFAATLRSDPPPSRARVPAQSGRPARFVSKLTMSLAAIAVAGAFAGSVIAWAVARPTTAARSIDGARPAIAPSASVATPAWASSAASVHGAPMASAVLAPPPPAVPFASQAAVELAGPSRGASSATAAPTGHPATSAATARNRADQKGLAAENPFR